jgi:hypothetical protein
LLQTSTKTFHEGTDLLTRPSDKKEVAEEETPKHVTAGRLQQRQNSTNDVPSYLKATVSTTAAKAATRKIQSQSTTMPPRARRKHRASHELTAERLPQSARLSTGMTPTNFTRYVDACKRFIHQAIHDPYALPIDEQTEDALEMGPGGYSDEHHRNLTPSLPQAFIPPHSISPDPQTRFFAHRRPNSAQPSRSRASERSSRRRTSVGPVHLNTYYRQASAASSSGNNVEYETRNAEKDRYRGIRNVGKRFGTPSGYELYTHGDSNYMTTTIPVYNGLMSPSTYHPSPRDMYSAFPV